LGDVSLFYSCCEVHWALDAFKNIMMKIGPNAPALDGLCIYIYVSDEYNIWKSPLGNYKKNE
jgi:hypothetical protein